MNSEHIAVRGVFSKVRERWPAMGLRVVAWVCAAVVVFLIQVYYAVVLGRGIFEGALDWIVGLGGVAVLGELVLWVVKKSLSGERRAEQLLELADVIFLVLDEDGKVRSINRAGCEILGLPRRDIVGRDWIEHFVPEPHKEYAREALRAVFAGEDAGAERENRIHTAAGEERIIAWHSTIVRNENGARGVLSSGMDITERKQAEATIQQLAYRDAVTGLPNRALFEDRLQVSLARARRYEQPLVVMLLDIDDFKRINDTLGHAAGDHVLRVVGGRLKSVLRQSDTVARIGGDEFTILLNESDGGSDVETVAGKIFAAVRKPLAWKQEQLHVSISMGAARYPDHGADARALVHHADEAMYQVKRAGRDDWRWFAHPSDPDA